MECRALFIPSPSLSPRTQIYCAPMVTYLRTGACIPLSSHGPLETRCWVMRNVECNDLLQSCCAVSPPRTENLVDLQGTALDKVGTIGLEFQRPFAVSFGKYMVREAVLDEEYWAAAWLRAIIYSEEQPYCRYIDSSRKKFAEQEFTALKRRCFGRQGQCIRCVCLVAVTLEESGDGIDKISHQALRDRVVGTLDISLRQLLRGETFPKELFSTNPLTIREPDSKCGYVANVCVARSARRQGIASSLLEVAVKAAKSWKLKNLYVHVNINNNAAQRLYIKTGFQVVEEAVSQLSREQQLLSMCI